MVGLVNPASHPGPTPISIADYDQLLERLEGLPKLEPGKVRVFRGQSGNYSKMLPSGLRSEGPYRGSIWRSYMRAIAFGMPGASGQINNVTLYGLWIEAIAQHYGTGSRFLDVTTDKDVALWFALHKGESDTIWEKAKTAAPVEESHEFAGVQGVEEVPVAHHTFSYSKIIDEIGWLYVFDVPKWNGREEPVHGSLIELVEAPPLLEFKSSRRMIVQSACLLAADTRKGNGGDLAGFYACDPIPVRWPLTGSDSAKKTLSDLFPDADEDPWYALFLSIPFHVRRGHPQFITDLTRGEGWIKPVSSYWTRPLPVTVYVEGIGEKSLDRKPIASRSNLLDPPFVFQRKLAEAPADKQDAGEFIDESSPAIRKYPIDEATVIMLESPLISVLPSLALWNHGLLRDGLAENTESVSARKPPEGPIVMEDGRWTTKLTPEQEVDYSALLSTPFSLTNVFLELSPLEQIEWIKVGDRSAKVLRALWLRHNRKRFVLNLYHQEPRPDDGIPHVSEEGPYYFTFNERDQRFAAAIFENERWRRLDISDEHPPDKVFFTTLMLLRALSPGPGLELKVDPFHSEAEKEGDAWKFRVAVRARSAQLGEGVILPDDHEILSIIGPWSQRSLHEGWLANEPYDLLSTPVHSYVTLTTKGPWQEVDAGEIRKWVDENLSYKV